MKHDRIIPVPDKHILGSPQGTMIVLWTIREHGPLSFAKLYQLVYGYKEYGPSQLNFISHALSELAVSALIEFDGVKDPSEFRPFGRQIAKLPDGATIRVAPAVDSIQHLFKISITDYALGLAQRLTVDPVFGFPSRRRKDGWADIFVLMPFAAAPKPVYDDHILSVTKHLGIRCERADDFFSSESVIDEVWSAICNAKVCIADCTGRNPNVFYELGIAHTLGRPCVLIAQSVDDIPFDVRHRRAIVYSFTPRGMEEFEDTLSKTLSNEIDLAKKADK
jgi:hypothetical protein